MDKERSVLDTIYRKLKRLTEEEQDYIFSLIEPHLQKKNTGYRHDVDVINDLRSKGEKKIVAIDFDGVLHDYHGEWSPPTVFLGGPYKGAFTFLESVVHTEDLVAVIFSARLKYDGAKEAILSWMEKHGCPEDIRTKLHFSAVKPSFHILIDDCAFPFEGSYPDPSVLRAFKPHWEQ